MFEGIAGTLFVLFICLCSKYIREKKVLSGICISDLSFSIVGVQFINASMFLGESDSGLFYYILSPYRHSQHIAPCILPVLMLDISQIHFTDMHSLALTAPSVLAHTIQD